MISHAFSQAGLDEAFPRGFYEYNDTALPGPCRLDVSRRVFFAMHAIILSGLLDFDAFRRHICHWHHREQSFSGFIDPGPLFGDFRHYR